MNFDEQLKSLISKIDSFVTSDKSTDEIAKFGELKQEAEKLGESHKETADELVKMKDLYIKQVQNYGTGARPENPNDPEDDEVSLEKIGADIIKNRKQ